MQATEGTATIDRKYYDHVTGATNAGFLHGAYHFARPGSSSGSTQATFFLANGGSWTADGMTLPGMLDIENNPSGPQCYGLSQSSMVSWITDFVDTYSGMTGRFPMIYTTNNFWTTCTGNFSKFAHYCPLVLAKYASSPGAVPGGWPSYTIWQNSQSYLYGGDSDIFNGDEAALLGLASGIRTDSFRSETVAETATLQVILNEARDALAKSPRAFYINLTIDSSSETSRATDDPWSVTTSVTFRDGSVSLLCVCSGSGGATMTTLPWRLANTIAVRNAYMRHGTRPDPVTGTPVDFFAGVGAGGVHMVGDSDDGPIDMTCPAGCISWWSYGRLISGRDSDLQVVIPPPGGLYGKITGPDGGLRAGAMNAKCIGTPLPADFRCVAGGRECVYAGGPCIVLFYVSPGEPGYSITAACAGAFFTDEGSSTAGACAGDMLSVTDLTQIVEYSQEYK